MRIAIAPRLSGGGYVYMHEINICGVGRKICRNCVDYLWIVRKPDKFNRVGKSTVYRKDELEERKEEL